MAKGNDENNRNYTGDDVPHERQEPRPDFSKPPEKRALPAYLQEKLDNEEKLWETLYEGKSPESTDSSVRYAAYASRVRTILTSAHRYVAYTSDIGESFRPVAHPHLIRAAYGVSWAYLAGDVAHEGYKAYLRNQRVLNPQSAASSSPGGASASTVATSSTTTSSDKHAPAAPSSTKLGPGVTGRSTGAVQAEGGAGADGAVARVPALDDYRTVMAQRAIFQGLASMGLPAFTIHSVVKYSGRAMKGVKNVKLRTWGPIGLGLAVVPFLPYIFDEPVEHAVEWAFHQGFAAVGGPGAVARSPPTGRSQLLQTEAQAGAAKEKKEL
ncbi:mitochondrial 18 KDa protein-domain-containing protein [Phyllosticta citrichinensis]|uniref:Mitochondrial fission process protein 1 n=1 Tax=Phyllosticta citrichinensis TaxID=1130410 RepID=A0ABR1XLV9_9PEZI